MADCRQIKVVTNSNQLQDEESTDKKLKKTTLENYRDSRNKWKLLFLCLCLFVVFATSCIVYILYHYKITFTEYKHQFHVHLQKRDENMEVVHPQPLLHSQSHSQGFGSNKADNSNLKLTNDKIHSRTINIKDKKIQQNDENLKTKRRKKNLKETERMQYHTLVADQLFAQNIEKNLDYLSSTAHLAGTEEGNIQAEWLAHKFRSYAFDNVVVKRYNVLLSYPTGPGNLTLFDKAGKETGNISIVEKKIDIFEKTTKNSIFPPFLAFSESTKAEGEMVYVNFGQESDFRALKDLNIDMKDKIALIRYGQISRNKKIKYAEAHNVKGVILFSDPDTYSPTGVYYPDSWYLPPDGVQRGTLLRMRGDPLTRGYPAIDGLYKRPLNEVEYFPKVPVQPIGYGDAKKLLSTLDGLSPPNKKWHGALNTTYNVVSKDHRKVKLHVNVTRELRDIKNVIATIEGDTEPDRLIIVGNHRDAWTYGAADPSSGTAVMLEVARALAWLKEKGWSPRRTIMFCSWDAEEYGLMGSTEWTEEFAKILTHQAIAYINVDTAVQGNHTIELKSTPEMVDVFFDAARRFKDPDSEDNFYDVWVKKHKEDLRDQRKEPRVRMFREGSDYMPFYADLGIPSMDFRYMFNTKDMGVFNYPVYHTMHDNIAWMKKFVDPDFRYHTTIAKIWAQNLAEIAKKAGISESCEQCSFALLKDAVKELRNASRDFHNRLKDLDKTDLLAVRGANDQMMVFERTFVTSEDIPGEPSTRHVYHTAGLLKALQAYIDDRDNNSLLIEFQKKYSIYTYHVMMASHALKNPFINKGKEPPAKELDPTE